MTAPFKHERFVLPSLHAANKLATLNTGPKGVAEMMAIQERSSVDATAEQTEIQDGNMIMVMID